MDYVKTIMVHLVVEQRRDGEKNERHAFKQKFGLLVCKSWLVLVVWMSYEFFT